MLRNTRRHCFIFEAEHKPKKKVYGKKIWIKAYFLPHFFYPPIFLYIFFYFQQNNISWTRRRREKNMSPYQEPWAMKQQMTAIIFKGESYSFICRMYTSYNVVFKWSSRQICPTLVFKQDFCKYSILFLEFTISFSFKSHSSLFFVLLITSKRCFFFSFSYRWVWTFVGRIITKKNKVERVMESFYQMLVTYIFIEYSEFSVSIQ